MNTNMSFHEFLSHFSTKKACADHLFQAKWPNGFVCPSCNHRHAYQITTRRLPLFQCIHCHHQTSLTVGTIMEGSRTPLLKWFIAIYLISRTTTGISASELSEIIEVTYKTAWLILHKIRNAISVADSSVQLLGSIEVDQVDYGRPRLSSYLYPSKQRPLLIGASLDLQNQPIYLKIKLVPQNHLVHSYILSSGKQEFKEQQIDSDSTDIQFVLGRCKARKYKKLYPYFAKAYRWITTTFHGLGPRYLNAYLNEFCYRENHHNRITSIFNSLTSLCVNSRRITYAELIQ